MPSLPPQLLRRALVLDIVLAMGCLSLSLVTDEQLWSVFWACCALAAVVDALVAKRFLDQEEEA
ncbi:MAG: hypothetical protein AB8B70_11775 [Prochlorococcus sp.]